MDIVNDTPNQGLLLLNGLMVPDRLLITRTPLLAELLVRRPYDFEKPDVMYHFLGDGLIIAEGDQHKMLRRKSLSAFSHRHVQGLYPMLWKKALGFCDELQITFRWQDGSAMSGKTEVSSWESRIAFDTICAAELGHDSNVVQYPDSDSFFKDYNAVTGPHMFLYWAMSLWVSFRLVKILPWQKNREFLKGTESLHQACCNMVRNKKGAIESKAKMGKDSVEEQNMDILSLLIKSGEGFSDKELGNQLPSFLSAGKLRKEVRDALSASATTERNTNYDRSNIDIAGVLECLPILNGILNESLRLYPSISYTNREARCDTMLARQPIPKGTNIAISSCIINRPPDLWGPEADVFNPERWIDVVVDDTGGSLKWRPNKSGGATSNYHFMTFLHGPRNCIGEDFAKAELRCLIAAVVSRFEWTLDMEDKDVVPAGNIIIKPLHGLHLNMKILDE
ncbi:hypothetical protein VMCG_05167 [Cytospora schulzeri]|uniref:Cytochrome P450 n=1 Tax=Cytospora schulzeri TaxID=448051 RepID=A0A423WQF6_9PEZI|nr:hypothetical protein VMCG_05167 [Valsa malicola]